MCRDDKDMKTYNNYINNTDNKANISQVVDVYHDVPDCYTVECNVTASNALDESAPCTMVIPFPRGRFESVNDVTTHTADTCNDAPTGDVERHLVACVGVESAVWQDGQYLVAANSCEIPLVCVVGAFSMTTTMAFAMWSSHCVVNCLVDKCVLSKTDGVCDELVCMKCAKLA